MSIAERIKHLRTKTLRVTQEQLGQLAGVTKQAVSQWESGINKPDRDALLSLKKHRKINDEWLVDGTEPPILPSHNIINEEPAPYSPAPLPPRIQHVVTLFEALTTNQQERFLHQLEEQHQANDELLKELLAKHDSG